MRRTMWVGGLTALALAGCQAASFTPVAVRFVTTPERFEASSEAYSVQTRLVSASASDGYGWSSDNCEHRSSWSPRVALWGNGFTGQEVTHQTANLGPGQYTFVSYNEPNDAAVQGWFSVRRTGCEFVDALRAWKQMVPRQKESLAFNHQIRGETAPEDFAGFDKQVQALNRLERQLEDAAAHEQWLQREAKERHASLLKDAEVLVMPGERDLFRPTTSPAFDDADMARVRAGAPVSKLVVVADNQDIKSKMQAVNSVWREVTACKAVVNEDIERLERNKRYLTITDHVYHYEREFVDNENRIQHGLTCVAQFNEQLDELRAWKLALAFTGELVSPGEWTGTFDQVERELADQRVVLEAKKHRDELLFNDLEEDSPKRVALEQVKLRFARAIDAIDDQMKELSDARLALHTFRNTSDVIHRSADTLALAAVDWQYLPPNVRGVFEHEALMSVRLEAADSLFAPSQPTKRTAQTASYVPPFENR